MKKYDLSTVARMVRWIEQLTAMGPDAAGTPQAMEVYDQAIDAGLDDDLKLLLHAVGTLQLLEAEALRRYSEQRHGKTLDTVDDENTTTH